ncbi:MAG: fimbrillin family protein [Prevotella sp.]|nr:fimbrillin family protein [Prevotella sp.]
MKKYILPLMSIAMLMAMASCSSSDDAVEEIKEESKLVPMTFTATQESNVGTRAALNGNGVDWQAGDEISVFDGTDAGCNHQFSLTGDASLGKFSGIASSEATYFTAVYPYTEGAQLESDGIVSGITLPAEQTAYKDSFDPKAALMMAYSTNKSKLDFKNAVSLVKVTTQFACKKIVLSANEDIAGTGTLTMTFDNDTYTSSFTFNSGSSKTITLKPATGESFDAGTYYIVVPPTTLTNGFSISFINSADTKAYTRTSTKNNIFNRSKIKDLGTFTESGTSWTSTIESNGNVKASQQVDMGVFSINEKNYRLIFAKSNLTANGLAENEYDYGDYFAWGAKEPWYSSFSGNTFTWKPGKSGGYIPANAPYYNGSYTQYTTDGKTLEAADDAARQILNGDWQLPKKEIWVALYKANQNKVYWGPNNGDETLETISGIKGMKISKKDDSNTYIFLPAAGYVSGVVFKDVGSIFYYWSGSAASTGAYELTFWNSHVSAGGSGYRHFGYSVRPVRLVEE